MKSLRIFLTSLALAGAGTSQDIAIVPSATQTARKGASENFTGMAQIEWLFSADEPARLSGGLVSFGPGARTAWHTHPLGQTLIVTEGVGRVQQWGGKVQEIKKGDIVRIPPNVKHWHGAAPETIMSHIAIGERLEGKSVEWMEKVEDTQYSPQAAAGTAPSPETQPRPSQKAIGDFSPKLAQLTDDVLYGDVWERPELSKRDRSLVTVAALIAMNRPEQLRSHLGRARANGVKREELIETITHMAFYSGWPNAVTALGVAKEVLEEK